MRWVFLRCLAVCYGVAFASFWVQASGLIGSGGILPVAETIAAARATPAGFLGLPGLFWLSSSNLMIHAICGAGVAASVALLLGLLPGAASLALWALYLSLVNGSGIFLRFPLDHLLLEAGIVAVLLAPWVVREDPAHDPAPAGAAVWFGRWTLFRVIFVAGVAKLAGGDPTWRDLSALGHHFLTQPLPNPVSWLAYWLPKPVQALACLGALVLEIVFPLLIPVPGRGRRIAFLGLAGLQIALFATGNFGFINWVAASLCVLILDDDDLPERLRSRLAQGRGPRPGPSRADPVRATIAAALVLLGLARLLPATPPGQRGHGALGRVLASAEPWHLAPADDFFSHMTTERPEIVIEASIDGKQWSEIGFRWKPSNTNRLPMQVAPHMPRLDLVFWFAAHGWFVDRGFVDRFFGRILEGSPAVLGLMDSSSLARLKGPPIMVRARLYQYSYTSPSVAFRTGQWWSRSLIRDYAPALKRVP